MAAVPRTEPVAMRLDEALAELQATADGPEAARRVADLAEAWLGLDPVPGADAGSDAPPAGPGSAPGLDALVLDAAMPRLLDAGALRPERLLGLLEEIAAIVPVDAATAEPLAAVGAAMIEEELAKYRLLLGLQNALIEA